MSGFSFLSVCSGIEAASVAWAPLGWKAWGFSEIEPFPCALLAHRYPDVPNHGDMTCFKDWPDGRFDLLCGGTPCQSFSVAGLRKGLADPRGNLALTYLAIADRYRPDWLLWENVPGVLSSNGGRDFGALLGAVGQLGYGFAWRVLDAQYVRVDGYGRAVPQRRRRVFLIGYLGDWRPAAAVLFEPESLRGHPAPGRQAGEGSSADVSPSLVSSGRGVERAGETRGQDPVVAVSPTLRAGGNRTGGNRPPGTDVDTVDSLVAVGFGGGKTGGPLDAAACLTAKGVRQDFEVETFIAHSLRGEGFDASEDGTGRGTPIVAAIQERAVCENPDAGPDGAGVRTDGAAYTLEARTVPQAVAFDLRGRDGGAQPEGAHDTAAIRAASGGSSRSYVAGMGVRRLTPRECERLQGFPDDYTLIPWRKGMAPDGPRYKALGNSWAVNCARWIGRRIDLVREVMAEIELERAA